MVSRKITTLNPYVTSMNQKYVMAKDYNLLYDDVKTLTDKKLTIVEASTRYLTVADSGKVFFIDAATTAATFVLPVPTVGVHFKWIWVADSGNANLVIRTADTTDTTGDMLRGGVLVCAAAAVNTFTEAASDVNSFTANNSTANASAGIGSWVEIVGIEDPLWSITGVMNSNVGAGYTGSAYFTDID